MRILLYSPVFAPGIGGIETVGGILAAEWTRLGIDVTVATPEPETDSKSETYPIIRQPGYGQLVQLARSSDLVFHNHFNMKMFFAGLPSGTRQAAVIHTWIGSSDQRQSMKDRIRNRCLGSIPKIAVSEAIAKHLPGKVYVVPNPYRNDLFHHRDDPMARESRIVFVGRLVSDKGADILIQALGKLARDGVNVAASIIGDGPESNSLQQLANDLKLGTRVQFLGSLSSEQVAQELRSATISVIPSRWKEPFGLVALESLACGCIPVASNSGGLPEAIGKCGLLFESGNPDSLAEKIHAIMSSSSKRAQLLKFADEHLARHAPTAVARKYLETFADFLPGFMKL